MKHSPLIDLYDIIKEVQKIMKTTPRSLWWNTIMYKFKLTNGRPHDYFYPVIVDHEHNLYIYNNPYKAKAICMCFYGADDIFVYKSNIRSEYMPHIEKLMHVKDDIEMNILQMEHEIWKSTQKH